MWREWFKVKYEEQDEKKAKNLRTKWGNCVTEFGELISQEVKTNPRYNKLRTDIGIPEPDR